MNNLYFDFVKETLNWDSISDVDSFVTYEIQEYNDDKCLKICEMYIDKKARGKNKSLELLDKLKKIAESNNCNYFSAQISQTASEFIKQRSIHICRLYGMQKIYEDSTVLIYSRGL